MKREAHKEKTISYKQGEAVLIQEQPLLLTHITPRDVLQADLFGAFSFDEHERKQRLMESLDEIFSVIRSTNK